MDPEFFKVFAINFPSVLLISEHVVNLFFTWVENVSIYRPKG